MATARTILLADPDPAAARVLSPALRARGFAVHPVKDGSRALEQAVLRAPDLVLFDEACPLIDAKTFVQILRTNPRTDHIPVVLTGPRVPPEGVAYVRKPYDADAVLARIDEVLRRVEVARERHGEQEIQGNLTHLSVADLLQVFAMNQKSGRLTLRFGAEAADVIVVDGRVRDARGPHVTGEKALFRYLARRHGTFSFQPGRPASNDRIGRTTEDLLLEGMRQSDEFARLAANLPAPSTHVFLTTEPAETPLRDDAERELVKLLDAGGLAVGELVDRASATDWESARALSELLVRGVVRAAPSTSAPVVAPLVSPAELELLRARASRGRVAPAGIELVAKVLVATPGESVVRRVADRLLALPGMRLEPGAPAVGTFGRIRVGPGLSLDLVAVSTHDSIRPLWRPNASRALGALVFDTGPGGAAFASFLADEPGLPAVLARAEAPLDPLEALRALIARVVRAAPTPVSAAPARISAALGAP